MSAVIGSWKIIAILAPRMPRICRSLWPTRSSPPKRMAPLVLAESTRRSTDSAVIDLPEPDSPTSANFSPGAMLNDTSLTTVLVTTLLLLTFIGDALRDAFDTRKS